MSITDQPSWLDAVLFALLKSKVYFGRPCSFHFRAYFSLQVLRLRRFVYVHSLQQLAQVDPLIMLSSLGAHQTYPDAIRVWISDSLPLPIWELVAAHEILHAVLRQKGFPATGRRIEPRAKETADEWLRRVRQESHFCPVALLTNTLLDVVVDEQLMHCGFARPMESLDRRRFRNWLAGTERASLSPDNVSALALWVAIYLRCHFFESFPHRDSLRWAILERLPAAIPWIRRTVEACERFDWRTPSGAVAAFRALRDLWEKWSPSSRVLIFVSPDRAV